MGIELSKRDNMSIIHQFNVMVGTVCLNYGRRFILLLPNVHETLLPFLIIFGRTQFACKVTVFFRDVQVFGGFYNKNI